MRSSIQLQQSILWKLEINKKIIYFLLGIFFYVGGFFENVSKTCLKIANILLRHDKHLIKIWRGSVELFEFLFRINNQTYLEL